jgi:hypothetical protein
VVYRIKTGEIISDTVWTIIQVNTAIIIGELIIDDTDYSIINTCYAVIAMERAIIAGECGGN